MSIKTQIERISQNVSNTYSALEEMGATMPEEQNSSNMAATVLTVPRGGGVSVQADWNQNDETAADFIKNKPVVITGGGDTLTWDINTDGLANMEETFYHVSNAVPAMNDFTNGFSLVVNDIQVSFTHDNVVNNDGQIALMISESGSEVKIPGVAILGEEKAQEYGLPKGIYFIRLDITGTGNYFTVSQLTIPGYTGFATKKLNDELMPSYNDLKDKPFGDELVELMPETEVVVEDDGSGVYETAIEATSFSGEESVLTVTFDGTKYTCYDISGKVGYPYPVFGNSLLFTGEDTGEDTGEPFCMVIAADMGLVLIVLNDTNIHTISISGIKTQKLPNEFYDGVAVFYFSRLSKYLFKDPFCSLQATKADVMQVVKKMPIILSLVDHEFYSITGMNVINDYVEVVYGANNASLYTAEYTE